ncbi:hypothetical protein AVEN_129117-1 [Araneus ventricosus]|uniref:Uncharacterized protein n=1 Tax=Araneus ventricosus TaxID=182803 RepID=A0A4Y2H616_ARAVE|nr:hypothetical protein AVEN_129117-1 [Araneus ventricosus]
MPARDSNPCQHGSTKHGVLPTLPPILNRNHDAAESVNPIPIHESDSADSQIRIHGFTNPILQIRSFWLESDPVVPLRSRIRGFVPE